MLINNNTVLLPDQVVIQVAPTCILLMRNHCHRPIANVAECPIDGLDRLDRHNDCHQLADSQDGTSAAAAVGDVAIEAPGMLAPAVCHANSTIAALEHRCHCSFDGEHWPANRCHFSAMWPLIPEKLWFDRALATLAADDDDCDCDWAIDSATMAVAAAVGGGANDDGDDGRRVGMNWPNCLEASVPTDGPFAVLAASVFDVDKTLAMSASPA